MYIVGRYGVDMDGIDRTFYVRYNSVDPQPASLVTQNSGHYT